MAETLLSGRPAAPGIAIGKAAPLARHFATRTPRGDPRDEAADFMGAVRASADALAMLIAAQSGDAADMLAFQYAMLTDPALTDPVLHAIASGTPADAAWRTAMAAEIAIYRDGDDETFAARATDLADLEARVLAQLTGAADNAAPPGAVLVGTDITPSRFVATDWSRGGGIVLAEGSAASHVAMLARARGVPMVVGLGASALALDGTVLVDGGAGEVVGNAAPATRAQFARRQAAQGAKDAAALAVSAHPAVTACGTHVAMLVNIGDLGELARIDPAICDGVGLTRTEFLFGAGRALPSEDEQLAAYAEVLRWAGGRPVTIRTLDAGADKAIPGLTPAHESNPFLGLRGIRLSLAHPQVFRVQLRALARAAVRGPLKVMLPMVAVPAELEAARTLLTQEVAALRASGIAAAMPPLGIMVEVPAAALAIDTFDAAFVSIGSNDLTQYVMAAARDIGAVAGLVDVRHEAVLRLIRMVVVAARAKTIEASLCGDAGGDPAAIPDLLRTGLRVLSAAPGLVGHAKLAIGATDLLSAGAAAA